MQFIAVLVTLVLLVKGQEVDDETRKRIDEIFTSERNGSTSGALDPLNDLEEVTQANLGSFGASDKCGEGSTRGLRMCVSYHMCDGTTNTIVQQGVTDGFGIIDIRFGANACPHPLQVCCKIPEGGLQNTNITDIRIDTNDTVITEEPIRPVTQEPTPIQPPVTPAQPSYCGRRNPNGIDFKITGDKDNEAEYGEFPWVVAILNRNYIAHGLDKPLICGGSLITPNVVLTAAHCVYKFTTADLQVRAGEWDTQTTRERLPYQERTVRQIITHPNFNNGNLWNDFAILILEESIVRAENVGTICLPSQGQRINSRQCFVSGWGKDEFGSKGKFQAILKKIELPTVEHGRCEAALRSTRLGLQFELDKSFTCAGGERGRDACTGDGGSPLVCPDPMNPERYMQVGIVAWGIGCGSQNVPGVYGDVAQFRSWIDQELRRLNIDNSPYRL